MTNQFFLAILTIYALVYSFSLLNKFQNKLLALKLGIWTCVYSKSYHVLISKRSSCFIFCISL